MFFIFHFVFVSLVLRREQTAHRLFNELAQEIKEEKSFFFYFIGGLNVRNEMDFYFSRPKWSTIKMMIMKRRCKIVRH